MINCRVFATLEGFHVCRPLFVHECVIKACMLAGACSLVFAKCSHVYVLTYVFAFCACVCLPVQGLGVGLAVSRGWKGGVGGEGCQVRSSQEAPGAPETRAPAC